MKDKLALEKDSLELKNKELDAYKTYLADLYGKLATYVVVAKETVEWVNEELKKKKVPINFGFPPGEILGIDFNNFDKKPKKEDV